MAKVFLDTSFLISLVNSNEKNHVTAQKYWKYMLAEKHRLYVSTIVISEFSTRQPMPPEILRNCIPVVFNFEDAALSGVLDFKGYTPGAAASRVQIKDDVKIAANAHNNKMDYVITGDKEMLKNIIDNAKKNHGMNCTTICIDEPYSEAPFNDGQQQLISAYDE